MATALRLALLPLSGRGSPYVLFFSASLLTAVFAGVAPAVLAISLCALVVRVLFLDPEGHTASQLAVQTALYAIDGVVLLAVTVTLARRRRHLEETEVALRRASEERSRALVRVRDAIEHAPDAYVLADAGSRLLEVNQATCRLLGYEQRELIGRSLFDLVVPEEHERMRAIYAELRAPGAVVHSEWTLRRKDEAHVAVEVNTNALEAGRWQGFVRDVTERRRIAAEREALLARERAARRESESNAALLRESEERFRLTIDEAPIGMALIDLDGRFVRVNRALCEITGYRPEELTRRTYQEITHPDDLDTDVELAAQVARGEIPRYQLEKRYIRKDGSLVDIMLSVSILRAPDGAARYYISQMEDITARKQADDALRRSEAKFSGIVSISTDAIIAVDAARRITLFNEGAEQIFGYTAQEALGTSLDRLIPERFRESHAVHFARFAADRQVARTMGARRELFGLRRNGAEFPAEASISKVTVGEETFFSVVLRDVTERRRTQAELQAALRARDQVLGIVAHDLRNPLNTIMMQASQLQRDGAWPERRDQRPRMVIERSARRMNRLIQDLLDVARAEAGKLRVERQRLSANDVVREAVQAHAALASTAELELRLEAEESVGDVMGDRHRLLQVLDNLIGNALKFTEPGGRVVVRTAADRDAVVFSVADTGPGIAPENLPHVFEAFWQAATRSRRLGAGLGLPISKGVVESHGGRMWVESAEGRGTTFHFAIPAAPPGDGRPTDVPSARRPTRRSLPGRTRKQRS